MGVWVGAAEQGVNKSESNDSLNTIQHMQTFLKSVVFTFKVGHALAPSKPRDAR